MVFGLRDGQVVDFFTGLLPEAQLRAWIERLLPTAAERFFSFPGARELSENPKIVALRQDTQIPDLIAQHRFFDLLQNNKVLEAVNDPTLARQIQNFDWNGALDYALERRKVTGDQ